MSAERLDALRAAVALSPDNHALRLVLAETLGAAGLGDEALTEFEVVLDAGALPAAEAVDVGTAAAHAGRLQLAARCLDLARAAGVVGGTAGLEELLTSLLADTGVVRRAEAPDLQDLEPHVGSLVEDETIRFADVGGLDEVKHAIHRTIILPYQRPDLYARYGQTPGGGVLLYGPPGCGKTFLAKATAGECGTPFLNLRIEDVLDPYFGGTEQRLHAAFSSARDHAPCVLFVDELDAFAYSRRKARGIARGVVDQLLQEFDAMGADNHEMLVLAATNVPWDVDDALQRPGRFDRVVFVPPPDPAARLAILERELRRCPTGDLDLGRIADATAMFSGADLRALVERAVTAAIDESLARGGADEPVTQAHLKAATAALRPTTLDWLRTARNYVEFANGSGRYDDVREFLDQRDTRAALRA